VPVNTKSPLTSRWVPLDIGWSWRTSGSEENRMHRIKVVHDATGHTLTVWLDDPAREHICEETAEEVVIMKNLEGKVIGFELLHYQPTDAEFGLNVETVVRAET